MSLNIQKFAAIDIGSNAVRLLISNVFEHQRKTYFKKASLIRVPVRLGVDSFLNHQISPENTELLLQTLKGFGHLLAANRVVYYKGCATSAMRDAANGQEIVKRIKKEANINIEIIDGALEAQIINSTQSQLQFPDLNNFIYVDVGGGSTEITVFLNHKKVDSVSFNIGTLRVLNENVDEEEWNRMKKWLNQINTKHEDLEIIGSGGNINKVFKMSLRPQSKPLSLKYINERLRYLNSFSVDERIRILDLNPDRADVIVPALQIFRNVMRWSHSKKVYVPKIGLSDGIIRIAYEEYKKMHASIEK